MKEKRSASTFNPEKGQYELADKIVIGLERISEVFKSRLWEYAKVLALSPIQIRILIFTAYHKKGLCKVSYLAREFSITKPTVSDAIKVLIRKGMIIKEISSSDSRSYSISLTDHGRQVVAESENFANPIRNHLSEINTDSLKNLYQSLTEVIHQLHTSKIIEVQRTCLSCRFLRAKDGSHFCNFLKEELDPQDIRLDCTDFEEKL